MQQSAPPTGKHHFRTGWAIRLNVNSMVWWIWVVIAISMIAALSGYQAGQMIAMLIAACHAAVWLIRHKSVKHFPTQVRITFALWMVASFLPLMAPLLWSLTAGTCLFVLSGYCPVARMLLFLPINRTVPLTARQACKIIFHPPINGSVLEELTP